MSTRSPLRVGAVLFEGFELLDVFGPLEMFGGLRDEAAITTLALGPGNVRSTQGPACAAEGALGSGAGLDVLLVPGGYGTRREVQNPAFLAALRAECASSRIVASVCTGSALLAAAGLLDGRRATTNKKSYAWATSNGPRVAWVPKARWVVDGPFYTSSGVSAGMDMALALIASERGRDAAVSCAHHAEYEWHEDAAWDPFAALNGLA